MSLRSNLKQVKEEFKSDEKMLENAFRLEILWRRYRKYVYVALLCGVCGLVWLGVSSYMQAKRAQEASAAYAILAKDSQNKEALESLRKASPQFYDVYRYFHANGDRAVYEELKTSQNALIKGLAQYELATLELGEMIGGKDMAHADFSKVFHALEGVEYTALKDLGILQEAYVLIKQDKITEAHQKLALIAEGSPFFGEALALRHYGLIDSASLQPNAESKSAEANSAPQSTPAPKP